MTSRERLIQELNDTADPIIVEVLDFLCFLKTKQTQANTEHSEARADLNATNQSEPVALPKSPLHGKHPYHYDNPFAPAVPLADWDVLE